MARHLGRLKQLQGRIPVASKQLAKQQQGARDIQLQQAVSQAPAGAGVRQAQGMGAQLAGAAGQQQVARAQNVAGQTQQVAGAALAGNQAADQQRVANQQLSTQRETISTADRLGRLDTRLRRTLVDDQMTFQKDQAGRALLNDRQALDYAAANARSDQEFRDSMQSIEQASRRKLQLMETASRKLTQLMEQSSSKKVKGIDQDTRKFIAQKKIAIDSRIRDERRKAAARNSMWSQGMGIAGAVVGGIVTLNPMGAIAGYQAGSALGSGIAGATE